jgi:uncharacterized protein (DUF111 family)
MKKGRPGSRLEVLARTEQVPELEALIFSRTTTIGVRRSSVARRALPREERVVHVDGVRIRVKQSRGPSGLVRSKPEYEDVLQAAEALGLAPEAVHRRALLLAGSTTGAAETGRDGSVDR